MFFFQLFVARTSELAPYFLSGGFWGWGHTEILVKQDQPDEQKLGAHKANISMLTGAMCGQHTASAAPQERWKDIM